MRVAYEAAKRSPRRVSDGVWAIVPVKWLGEGKSRLAGALTATERRQLVDRLLRQVVGAALGAESLAGVLVVSPDPEALALAADLGAEGVADPEAGLNAALRRANDVALARGAGAVLVLPADLPHLTTEAVDELVKVAGERDGVRIVAAARDGGTNALFVRPAVAFEPEFGVDSARAHARAALRRGLPCEFLRLKPFAVDLDLPADLVTVDYWKRDECRR